MSLLLLAAVLFVALLLVPLGLPGTWLMVGAAVGYNALVGGDPVGWVTVVGTAAVALGAEVVEFSLSSRYARQYGGSRRAGWGAILGGIVGAVVGVPVPVIGSVVGAFVGAFAGAWVGERSAGSELGAATRVAQGALLGRVVAAAIKVSAGCVIAAWILLAAWA